ncbi:MAG: hypothetical protein ABJA50_03760, partial [Chloroflexota bacterium]
MDLAEEMGSEHGDVGEYFPAELGFAKRIPIVSSTLAVIGLAAMGWHHLAQPRRRSDGSITCHNDLSGKWGYASRSRVVSQERLLWGRNSRVLAHFPAGEEVCQHIALSLDRDSAALLESVFV